MKKSMIPTPKRQLVFEIERVQTVHRRISAYVGYCVECRCDANFVALPDLAATFDIPVAEAELQLRKRAVHMHHLADGSADVCAESLLTRTRSDHQILAKSLTPGSALPLTNSSG